MYFISKVRRWLYNRKIRKIHIRHRSQNYLDYSDIDEVINRFRNAGGLKHEYQPYKLFHLKKLIEKFQPSSILELGSGSSTAIFAAYVKGRVGASLCSVDESEAWLSNSKLLAGIDLNDARFEMLNCTAMVGVFGKLSCVGYGLAVDKPFDFVFVDGPSLRINGISCKEAINDDVFRLADIFPPRIIVVDGRYATVRALESHLSGSYHIQRSSLMARRPCEDYNYFSIFTRINK
jgi:hypothetical protein